MAQRSPAWLGPAAAKLFQPASQTLGVENSTHVPMAARGNDLFYVVDKSIRWADLEKAKEGEPEYRVLNLKRSFHEPVQQLIVSPSEELMAIVTPHSVCVIVLPDIWGSDEVINVRRHTIGETTHVRETAALAKVLWHPLGVDCLVTITASSELRLWELNRRNLASFSVPTVSIDLKKLRHAESQEDDVRARDIQDNQTFSIDNVEMEVTAACFGSNANEAQSFEWSGMTLWLTMSEGDIFALCPLLPRKFQADDDGTIPTLFALKAAEKEASDDVLAQSQYTWLGELQEQYDNFEAVPSQRVYHRPASQGLPRLQGPFVILPNEAQDELMPCDIHVIGASSAASVVREDDAGTSFSTVCVLGEDGRVHICLDIDGVEAQWLPPRKSQIESPPAELLLFEALDTLRPGDDAQGLRFTPNTSAEEYSFFVSHEKGVYKFDLSPWIHELEKEVQGGPEGVEFRTQVLEKTSGTDRQRILRTGSQSSVLISTEELGHMLLTVGSQVHAVVFSGPGAEEEPASWQKFEAAPVSRDMYHPSPAFTQPSGLGKIEVDPRHKRMLKEEIRLSSATLSVMTEAHRVLSRETTALNDAAADLFRRCDRLHEEFKLQIERMSDIADRIETDRVDVEQRLDRVRERQTGLSQRHEALRLKLARAGGKPLSGKERAWVGEVKKITGKVEDGDMQERLKELQSIARELLEQAKDRGEEKGENGHSTVPPDIRRGKVTQVQELLDRETALIDAAVLKLARLGVAEV